MMRDGGVMGLEILHEMVDSTTLACAVADEYDFVRIHQLLGDVLIKGRFLRSSFPFVVRLFPVDEVMMKPEWIVRKQRFFARRTWCIGVSVDVSRMMVDYHNDAGWFRVVASANPLWEGLSSMPSGLTDYWGYNPV
jgi:hypothetical protein